MAVLTTRLAWGTSLSIFTAACTLSFATGCAKSDSSAPTGRVVPKSYDPDLCVADKANPQSNRLGFKPTDGDEALFANAGQTRIVESNFFEKFYNAPDHEAVLHANAISTGEYAKAIGVTPFRIPHKFDVENARYCQTYYALDEASDNYKKLWEEKAGGDLGGGSLAGLYFDDCYRDQSCSKTQVLKPVILVDDATDRWTIVHELMHYNFDKTRKLRGEDNALTLDKKVGQSLGLVEADLKAYDTQPNQDDLKKAAVELNNTAHLLYRTLADSSLEEIAIEAQLIDESFDGRLGFVSPRSPASSHWYIQFSKAPAIERLKALIEIVTAIDKNAKEKFWQDIVDQDAATLNFIDDISRRLDEVEETACVHSKTTRACHAPQTPATAAQLAAFVALTNPHLANLERMNPALATFDRGILRLKRRK